MEIIRREEIADNAHRNVPDLRVWGEVSASSDEFNQVPAPQALTDVVDSPGQLTQHQ
jgi:hypothetical protein